MRIFLTVKLITLFKFLYLHANAGLSSDCIARSGNSVGQVLGIEVTNEQDLIFDAPASDMRLATFTACTDATGDLSGLRFTLRSESTSQEQRLTPIGSLSKGDCRELELTG